MQTLPPHKALARWLADRLRSGVAVTDAVRAYMETTFGSTDIDLLLADAEGTDTDSLLELIFYPDVETQLEYESRWGTQVFTDDQLSDVKTTLCAEPLVVPLISSRDGRRSQVRVPDFALKAFVQRLNITWQAAAPLARAIETSSPGGQGLRPRVHLRNARLAWHSGQVELTVRFFSKIQTDTAESEQLLLFLIAILPELELATDAFEFLIAKKFFYFQSLCKAEDYERKRKNSNMEIMMLQGSRSAYGSLEEWRQSMRHIDTLCQHLFGRTHFFRQPGNECIDIQAGDGVQQIKDVMRILS